MGLEGDVVRRGVVGREGNVVLGVVVLRGDSKDEPGQREEGVDQRGDIATTVDGE